MIMILNVLNKIIYNMYYKNNIQNRENDKSNLTRSVQNSKFKIKKITIKLKTTSSEFKIQNRENNKSNLTRSVQNSKSKKWQIQTNTTIKLNTTSSDGWICHFLDSELVVLGWICYFLDFVLIVLGRICLFLDYI
ncbi:hypothetical protein DERF_003086 [Dermatophagoides farinae]|uniref:Transmembrane protein n=1 Tax=Dermatophagoides farinae TaxID=6954 RepID=A0A922IBX2_DERFA|nr:hypothetical protein DERF_003086 [Dermatophagoides farinae]